MTISDSKRTEEEIDEISARPLTEEDMQRMKRVPRVATMRRSMGLTQEEFSARFGIPLGTLRDWEQGRTEPDATAKAYLKVIAFQPETVMKALQPKVAA
jgi:putative transcriptional regulator